MGSTVAERSQLNSTARSHVAKPEEHRAVQGGSLTATEQNSHQQVYCLELSSQEPAGAIFEAQQRVFPRTVCPTQIIGIFQIIPYTTLTGGIPTIYIPLSIITIASGIKDFYEDCKRSESDKSENAAVYQKVSDNR